jgi:hypothetical protein
MLSRYLIPLAPFLLIGITSVLCLFFFLCLEHEMRIMNLRWKRRQNAQQSATQELKAEIAELSTRMLEAEERAGILVAPAPPKSGLNLNKRTQVIRMSRRGDQAEKIAASLNLPRREVELVLKVHGRVVYNSQPVERGFNSNAVNS